MKMKIDRNEQKWKKNGDYELLIFLYTLMKIVGSL
jgi:hypothetical protein